MKLFLVLGVIVGGYMYLLMHTTNIVLSQTQQLTATYQNAADQADKIANGN